MKIELTEAQVSTLMIDLEEKIDKHTKAILSIKSASVKAIFQEGINERIDIWKTLKKEWDK